MAVCTWVRNKFFSTVIVVENIVPIHLKRILHALVGNKLLLLKILFHGSNSFEKNFGWGTNFSIPEQNFQKILFHGTITGDT